MHICSENSEGIAVVEKVLEDKDMNEAGKCCKLLVHTIMLVV